MNPSPVDILRRLRSDLGKAIDVLARIRTTQVNKEVDKDSVRTLVDRYFREYRSLLTTSGKSSPAIAAVDGEMQNLLRWTQGRTATKTYLQTAKNLRSVLNSLELELMPVQMSVKQGPEVHGQERRILATLLQMCPVAAVSYEQGLRDVQSQDRKSWRGTATEFREALREVLDHLAPDGEVTSLANYTQEPGTNGPTMKQKALFIMRSRGLPKTTVRATTDAIEVAEEKFGSFVRSVYGRSSVSTHTPTTREGAIAVKNFVTIALSELLEVH